MKKSKAVQEIRDIINIYDLIENLVKPQPYWKTWHP